MSERLDIEIVIRELARSRSQASALITSGRISVNGRLAKKPSSKIEPGDKVELSAGIDFVSRAGHKLAHALSEFDVAPEGLCLDAGASTGGFTQVLLENGAERVLAVDVGHNQLVDFIRDDPRVVNLEGQNLRHLTGEQIIAAVGETPFSLVVVDLSFISLTLVTQKLAELAPTAEQIWLIKPQFEVGKHSLSATGVVSSRNERKRAVEQVLRGANDDGFYCHGLIESPIKGTNGNVEYLSLMKFESLDYGVEQLMVDKLFSNK